MSLYPMIFEPVYKEKIWGGRSLAALFGRELPPGQIGESWDVSAHPHGMSIVANGPLRGKTLAALAQDYPKELYGEVLESPDRFPLLVKLIDAREPLSVQVHPDDGYGREHENGEWGKSEMWYVLHAEPGATLVYGLRPGIDRSQFCTLVEQDRTREALNEITVRAGDILHIPAGLVHALGAGVVVAEVQQNSDTVYRVYDWGRVDSAGQSRELHVEKAFDVIDFSMHPQPVSDVRNPVVVDEHFVAEVLDKGHGGPVSDGRRFHILTCLEGEAEIVGEAGVLRLLPGDSCLVPAVCGDYGLQLSGQVLRAYQPIPFLDGAGKCMQRSGRNT